ncbi:DUF4159 domain-containing protein [Tenacibaculum sp. UWU-22]|uniref:DUF4159 domain-containing protein n=1 Tax=Tenacibaculum sp. UWU-22 TaxID=3234187 RepID=UPI0034DABEEA
MRHIIPLLSLFFFYATVYTQQVAVLKYSGGGDWYANPTSVTNLVSYTNQHCNTKIDKNVKTVTPNDEELFNYPIIFMTGHGNVFFSEEDIENLKNYLISGGFLEISDNYGMDKYIRKELQKMFPKLTLQEIPTNHPIYHQTFSFNNGIPKIHEHDGTPPQGLGLFYEGRLIVFYDYETDLSDGWEDQEVHKDPKEIREKALKMGANIIEYVFKN